MHSFDSLTFNEDPLIIKCISQDKNIIENINNSND